MKVGIIGCGTIAQRVHIPVLSRLPGAELVALAETDRGRREAAGRSVPSAALFADYAELLAGPGLDAVVISVPPALHAEVALKALERGLHVYIEKPLAARLADARDVVAAWRQAGVVGMMGFNYRFNPLVQTLRRHLDAGRVGPLTAVRSVFSLAAHALPEWQLSRAGGGGVLLDLASHHVDLIRFLFHQEISEVFARVSSRRTEADTALLEMRLANGVPAQSLFSQCAVEEDSFEVYGQNGKLTLDRYFFEQVQVTAPPHNKARVQQLAHRLRSFVPSRYLFDKLAAPLHETSYGSALAQFTAAVQGQGTVEVDLLDGYRSLAVIDAAEESAKAGRSVSCEARSRI